MNWSTVIGCGLLLLFVVFPIGLNIWVARTPRLLAPLAKLTVSLILVIGALVVPLFFPKFLADVAPTSPVVVGVLFSLIAMPQGFIGAAIAGALLYGKIDRNATEAHSWWWRLSLLGTIWSTMAIVALGISYADW